MTKDNPFPGMNPFLEGHWADVHSKLITYIADAIAEQLPPDLSARGEERVTLLDPRGEPQNLRADVAVVESWKQGIPPQWQPDGSAHGGVAITEPQFVFIEEETERWIEITDKDRRLITVIEVLSPTNKGDGIRNYKARRDAYISSGVNLVEIDLLRAGAHAIAVPLGSVRKRAPGTHYLTCVTRASFVTRREVYATPLRVPLPNISVPLRLEDQDAVLQLQPLVDRCHRMGGYWNADYRTVPGPVLPEDESAWTAERVAAAGLAA